jgi:predicted nuclease of predicted toxin-antitoxin system
MKLLVDAQLPRRLARLLQSAGHDVLHTLDLPRQNKTPDDEINTIAARDARVVVTKDSDFVATFLLSRRPPKLLLISTGNISNDVLCDLMTRTLPRLETLFEHHSFIELGTTAITVHV